MAVERIDSPGASRRDGAWRKRHGVYYTPRSVARAVTAWAVRDKCDKLLDPSFGGCDFLQAASETLAAMGTRRPLTRIYGVDVDPEAFKHLEMLPGGKSARGNFLKSDFFEVGTDQFDCRYFDAIVGNPPYVRHHHLSKQSISVAQDAVAKSGLWAPRSSGYWVYFVLRALEFLRPGGRLAMLLPLALLNAKYAKVVREILSSRFRHTRFILVQERLFANAEEGTVIVLAEGWEASNRSTKLAVAKNQDSLKRLCNNGVADSLPVDLCGKDKAWKRALISPGAVARFEAVLQHDEVFALSDLARIRIGVVTGANHFFVLSPSRARQLDIPERHLRAIIDSASNLGRLCVSRRAMDQIKAKDRTCLLLSIAPGRISRALRKYLESPQGDEASKAFKCRERDPWYRITDLTVPDAFLTYVNGNAPRLVLNETGVLCTNAVHRLWWREELHFRKQKLIALSFLTSLTGLSAELSGRSYGGGALKLEPSEAGRVVLGVPSKIPPMTDSYFSKASRLLTEGNWREANALADELILRNGLGLLPRTIRDLRSARDTLLSFRLRTPE